MLIKEACLKTGLTKKAIEYYEGQGLISPEVGENGYRIYHEGDIAALKEIALLRRLDVSVADIKEILTSCDKPSILQKCLIKAQIKSEKAAQIQICLQSLANDYDLDRAQSLINETLDAGCLIKEKLLQAFPGSYGVFLCTHFGRFLNEPVDTPEKQKAYDEIIGFLDGVVLPDHLDEFLSEFKSLSIEKSQSMQQSMDEALDNIDAFIQEKKDVLDSYVKFRTSKGFTQTQASQMQNTLLRFFRSSGYYDIFIPNLKILSSSYRSYTQKLDAANRVMLEKYPQFADIYKK